MRGTEQCLNNNMQNKRQTMFNEEDRGNLRNYIKQQKMIEVLNKKGIKKLLPVQQETYHLIYKGEDIVAKDRTGSGKTIAFALPTIMKMRAQIKFKAPHKPKFLIVLPTRQLAIQVKDEILSLRYKDEEDFVVTAVYGGVPIQQQLGPVAKGADIVVGTPGRLIDFLERRALDLTSLEVICLDEADEMLNIGFKEDIERIFRHITKAKSGQVQCLMFSATIPEWIWKMSDMYQSQTKIFIDMIKDGNVKTSKTVDHYCLGVSTYDKQSYISALIKDFFGDISGKMIIFCETKREVQRIGTSGMIPAKLEMLHGDFKQFQRQKVFHQFKNGKAQCLIATNVAARGLDFPQIDLIIQMQPPTTTDSYIHRSGRTGRAGKAGACVTLYDTHEGYLMERIERQAKIRFNHLDANKLKPLQKEKPRYMTISYSQWRDEMPQQNGYQNGSKDNYSYGGNQSWRMGRYESNTRGPNTRESMSQINY